MKLPEILYEDSHIIVCLKPAGTPSQSGRSRTPDMVSLLKTMLVRRNRNTASRKQQIQPPQIAVVHRLDQPVGGIMVYAKSQKAASGLSQQLRCHHTLKYYKALIACSFPEDAAVSGTLEDYLLSNPVTNRSDIVPAGTKDAKSAILTYKLEQRHRTLPISALDIQLTTGRHHQIRTQLSHHFAPILGDVKYGYSDADADSILPINPGEIGLFAYHLAFTHPVTKKRMTFESMPEHGVFRSFYQADTHDC